MDPEQNLTKRIRAFDNKCYRKVLHVSWTEHRTNQSIADELGVTSGTPMDCIKKQTFIISDLYKYTYTGEISTRRKSEMPKKQRKTKHMDNDAENWKEVSGEWDKQQKIG